MASRQSGRQLNSCSFIFSLVHDYLNRLIKKRENLRHGLERWRDMPPSAHARTVDTSLTFRGHNNNAVLQVKTSVTVGMAILANFGAGMDVARGEVFKGVKKEGFIKKQ